MHAYLPSGTVVKNLPANAGDTRDTCLIPVSGRSPGVGSGYPLQYSCLKSSMTEKPGRLWGHKESNATKHTHILAKSLYHYMYMYIDNR